MTPVQSPSNYTIHIQNQNFSNNTINIGAAQQSPLNAGEGRPVIASPRQSNLNVANARNIHSPVARRPANTGTDPDSPFGFQCCCAWTWRSKKANTGNLQPAGARHETNRRVSSTVVSGQHDSEALPETAHASVEIPEDTALRQLFTEDANDVANPLLNDLVQPGSPHYMQNEANFLITNAEYERAASPEQFHQILNNHFRSEQPTSPHLVNVSTESYKRVKEHEREIASGKEVNGKEFAAPRRSVEKLLKDNIRINSRLREDFKKIRKQSTSESTMTG